MLNQKQQKQKTAKRGGDNKESRLKRQDEIEEKRILRNFALCDK